jgi:Lactonase, 7-bladed beta-propeller
MQMRKLLVLIALPALLASVSFAATGTYVLTEDENTSANTATVFSLNTTTGVTTEVKKLSTGGTGLGGGFFAGTTVTISSNNDCIFVADTGSNDIAAFAAPSYAKVGNFSNAALNWSNSGDGGSIALSPNGKWLYGSYSGSENIGAWAVGTGCKLTYINSYTPSTGPDLFATLHVTPDGNALIVPSIDLELATMFSINSTTGALTEVNNVNWGSSVSLCATDGCYPYGFDISGDSKVAFFGDPTTANGGIYALACSVNTTTGLSNPKAFTLTNTANAENATYPWFPKSSYATGTGLLYIGMSGYYDPVENSGVVVAKVNETPALKVEASTVFATPNGSCDGCTGTIESHGALAVSAQIPNLINVYSVNAATGAFTLLKSNTDSNATSLLSLHVIPETR